MRAVLLDRDGVISENRDSYVTSREQFRFLPRALDALAALRSSGLRLAVVTNQSAVGRGLMARAALDEIHRGMLAVCERAGAPVDHLFACLHAPWHGCACRKPRPGLLLRAMAVLGEPPAQCVAIGDGPEDLLAARAAGVFFVLVRTGRGEATLRHPACRAWPPLFVAPDLWEAAQVLRQHVEGRAVHAR